MKNFILSVVLLCLLSGKSYSQPAWSPVYSGLGSQVSISFPSRLVGYVTDNPTTWQHYLKKTTDGGTTWTSQTIATSVSQVFFINELTGFIGPTLQKTTDGGATWISSGYSIAGINFVNDSLGFFFKGGTQQIFKTTNQGNSWNCILQGYHPDSSYFGGVLFADENTGYANTTWLRNHLNQHGEPVLGPFKWELLKTTNSGASWTKVIIPASYSTIGISAIKFFNGNSGYAVGSTSSGSHIIKTSNGGTDWTLVRSMLSGESISSYRFVDSLNVFAVGSYIFRSTNGCVSFTKQTVYSTNDQMYLSNNIIRDTVFIYNGRNYTIYKSPGIVAPVELASFTSNAVKRNVNLSWSTVSEENNSGFNIERKLSESNVWKTIGNVRGNGTTNSPSNYTYSDLNLSTGKYNYRLKQIDFNGNFKYYDLSGEVIIGTPDKFNLSQNYPNPFNPSTNINFDLPFDSKVQLKVLDITGKEISILMNEVKSAGYYTIKFNASVLPSGIYFYSINAGSVNQSFSKTMKMVLIK